MRVLKNAHPSKATTPMNKHIVLRLASLLFAFSAVCTTAFSVEETIVLEPFEVWGHSGDFPDVEWTHDTNYSAYDWADASAASAAGAGQSSTSAYPPSITGCLETSEFTDVNYNGMKGMKYTIEMPPNKTGIYYQGISITFTYADGSTKHAEFTEAMRSVAGAPGFTNGVNYGDTSWVDKNAIGMGLTNNGAALTGATYWITSTFVEGSSDILSPMGFTDSGSATQSSSGITLESGTLWIKPGWDSTMLAQGQGLITRGFTVTQNSTTPLLNFTKRSGCP